jgi:hypothetical protein
VANVFNKSMRPFQVESSNVQVDVTQLSVQNPGCIQQLGKCVDESGLLMMRVHMSDESVLYALSRRSHFLLF